MTSDFIKQKIYERSLRLAEVQQKTVLKKAVNSASDYFNNGQFSEAETVLTEVLKIEPKQPDALHLQGILAFERKAYAEAEKIIAEALTYQPDFPPAHYNRGNALRELGRREEAVVSYLTAIEQAPHFAAAICNLGLTYALLDQPENAFLFLQKALALEPKDTAALTNMGNLFRAQGNSEEALTYYKRALTYAPNYAVGHNNLGNALRDLGQTSAAITAFEQAISIAPDLAEAHNNLGLACLLTGDFTRGWFEYQWRFHLPSRPMPLHTYKQPLWDGRPFPNKTLYIYPEQGFGDVIQFSRYVPMAAELGGRIIFRIPPKLEGLLTTLNGVDQFILETDPLIPDFDFHIPLLELPRLLKTEQHTIPGQTPYLKPDSALIKKWATRMNGGSGKRIGLVWAGQPQHENDRNRSMDPHLFLPLTQLDGVSLYSLQMGHNDQAKKSFGQAIHDLAPQIKTFSDTAAAIKNLDLVISVDTSAAHLAGAMNAPIWTLLPYMPDWRWQLDRDDSPWYPSMRLFRQPCRQDWESVINRVTTTLISAPE